MLTLYSDFTLSKKGFEAKQQASGILQEYGKPVDSADKTNENENKL